MNISALERSQSAAWHHWDCSPDRYNLLVLGVWTEKSAGLGEDAEPLLVHHRGGGYGLLAVFDGAGGAGAAIAGRSHQGLERTGAWVGSRTARAAAEEWFHDTTQRQLRREPETLRAHLAQRLSQMRPHRHRKIIGTMPRELPSTIAALDYQVTSDHLSWQALWAGDSRSFLLDPADGLQQLSRDDTDNDDALVLLTEDPPMTNMLSADRNFTIHSAYGQAKLPCLLLCATDGFFGYVHTPADFEHVLLDTLRDAGSERGWCRLLVDRVNSYTADDASLALIAAGFEDFGSMRTQFTTRAHRLEDEHSAPRRHAANGDQSALREARKDSWDRYRISYEQRIPRAHGEEQQ
ncbi:MAG: protein phosphatase 2C domain-containing protein [Pseudonocardiaceae bacterium]